MVKIQQSTTNEQVEEMKSVTSRCRIEIYLIAKENNIFENLLFGWKVTVFKKHYLSEELFWTKKKKVIDFFLRFHLWY